MQFRDSVTSLKHLGAYLEALETGRIATASRNLRRSASAVSRSVRLLEDSFGCPLFIRSDDGLVPTPEGRLVAARIRAIRSELGSLMDALKCPGQPAARLMELDAPRLRAIVAVQDHGSAQRASQHLGLSQPAVSLTIREAEADLGVNLFRRTSKGMTATAAGETTRLYALRILNELRKMAEDIASTGGEPEGLVCIGGLAYSRSRLLPEAINHTIARHPRIVVRTVEGPLSSLLVAAHAGEIDAIICAQPDPAKLEGLTVEPIVEDQMGLFVNSGHPLAGQTGLQARDLLDFPFILPPVGSVTRSFLDETIMAEAGRAPHGSVETSSYSIIRRLLLGSDHICFRSMFEFEVDMADERVSPLDLAFPLRHRSICILQRPGSEQTLAVRRFLGLVRDIARGNALRPPPR